MGKPLSLDLRERAVADVEGGLSRRQAAASMRCDLRSPPCAAGATLPVALRWHQRTTLAGLTLKRKAIEGAKASLLYLPPYSPDFNPIEMAFSKLKALLRAAAPRTIPKLWQTIADAMDRFKTAECRAYFAAAGYDAT